MDSARFSRKHDGNRSIRFHSALNLNSYILSIRDILSRGHAQAACYAGGADEWEQQREFRAVSIAGQG